MPEETGFRFSGVGPASLNSLQLADLVEWSLDTDCKLDEVAHLAAKTKKSIPVNYGWEGSLKMELALTPRELGGSLAIGAWSGVNVSEWSFEAELETEEATGPYDLWRIHKAGKMSWTMDAEKWQATDDYRIFLQLLLAQAQAATPVTCASPYGSGLGIIEKPSFGADGKPAKGKMTIKSYGDLTSSDPLIALMITAATQVVTQGYAAPIPVALNYAASIPFASGMCLPKKISFKGPVGKVETEISFQGTGALTVH